MISSPVKYICLGLALTLISCSKKNAVDLELEVLPVDAAVKGDILEGPSVLNDPDRFVWGGSVVKGYDGKYHMLYSTWESGDSVPQFSNSWVLNSKIAYAVSDQPDRNFKFQKVVLTGRELQGDSLAWDAQMVHNPHLKKFNGKYYLYYIGSRDEGEQPEDSKAAQLNKRNRVQQNQKIGVVEFDNFENLMAGNFNRSSTPLLAPRTRVKPNNVLNPSPEGTEAKPDNLIVVNPSVVQRPSDGKYLMYFKGNIYDPNWKGVHGLALSDSPTGPFKAIDDIMFNIKMEDGKVASAEDPYVWYHKQRKVFYAVMKDFSGRITEGKPGLAILQSKDGVVWNKPNNPFFMRKEVTLVNGDVLPMNRLERPQILADDNGDPLALFAAGALIDVNQRKDGTSFNVHIPLRPKH